MNKAIVILALTSVASAGASASLYRKLHAEREHVQALEYEVQSLRTQPPPAHVTATPFSSVPVSSSKQATVPKPELVRQTLTGWLNSPRSQRRLPPRPITQNCANGSHVSSRR